MKLKYSILISGLVILLSCGGSKVASNSNYTPEGNSSSSSSGSENTSSTGEQLYKKHCTACHGTDGTMGVAGAKRIPESVMTQTERENLISTGKNTMPSFQGKMNQEEIKKVAEYTLTLK